MQKLYTKNGRKYEVATDGQILTMARLAVIRSAREAPVYFNDPLIAANFFTIQLAGLQHEVFGVAFLDNRHGLIAFEQMFRGTIDRTAVHPREVVTAALQHRASIAILCHNHPSGVVEPSPADQVITRRLRDALALIDVRVLDHFIVSGPSWLSMAGRGLV